MQAVVVSGLVRHGRCLHVTRRGSVTHVPVHVWRLLIVLDEAEILASHLFKRHVRTIEVWIPYRVSGWRDKPMREVGGGHGCTLRIELLSWRLILLKLIDKIRMPTHRPGGSSASVQVLSSVHTQSLCIDYRSSPSWNMCGHSAPSTSPWTLVATARLQDFGRPFEIGRDVLRQSSSVECTLGCGEARRVPPIGGGHLGQHFPYKWS